MEENNLEVPEESKLSEMVKQLCDGNRMEHDKLRKKLVSYGSGSLKFVPELLRNSKHHCRWEAMKLMEEIGDSESIPFFLDALDDEKGDIRWIAANGLVKTHRYSVKPLLKLLLEKSGDIFVLNAAHHVFSELKESHLLPDQFPVEEMLPLLKNSNDQMNLKILVHKTLNNLYQ